MKKSKPKKKQVEQLKDKGNKSQPMGRPLKFKSVSDLQKKIDEYFIKCDKGRTITTIYKWMPVNYVKPIPYTITWLASSLWTNRQTLINYTNKEDYFDTIKRAKEKIEANMEELSMMWESNPTTTIFSFKNNFGWVDKQEIDYTDKTIPIDKLYDEKQ